MYLSKAMRDLRSDPFGSSVLSTVEAPWSPRIQPAISAAQTMGGGTTESIYAGAAIVFSAGQPVSDEIWHVQSRALYNLSTFRAFVTANQPECVLDTVYASTGTLTINRVGGGKRIIDTGAGLGRFAYAKAFSHMYILIATSFTVPAPTAAASIATAIELTAQDLIDLGADLTDNGDGTFNLVGTINLTTFSFD